MVDFSRPLPPDPVELKLPLIQAKQDVMVRVRDLEVGMVDLKAGLERRMGQLMEEVMGGVSRDKGQREGREGQMWREQ